MSKKIVQERSFSFSVEIIKFSRELSNSREFVLSRQILRCGTSIGANISEAEYGQSTRDFISKLCIARKESNETIYWLRLLLAANCAPFERLNPLISECAQIRNLLTAIIISSQRKLK